MFMLFFKKKFLLKSSAATNPKVRYFSRSFHKVGQGHMSRLNSALKLQKTKKNESVLTLIHQKLLFVIYKLVIFVQKKSVFNLMFVFYMYALTIAFALT